jgi:8-oxo-dGTP diphosphatase
MSAIPITTALIKNKDNKYLLVQQQSRDYGEMTYLWYPPSGHLEKGETYKECLIREMKEELNIDIKPIKEMCVTKGDIKDYIVHWWECKLIGGTIQKDSTIKDFGYFTKEEIKKLNLFPQTRIFFNKYIWI